VLEGIGVSELSQVVKRLKEWKSEKSRAGGRFYSGLGKDRPHQLKRENSCATGDSSLFQTCPNGQVFWCEMNEHSPWEAVRCLDLTRKRAASAFYFQWVTPAPRKPMARTVAFGFAVQGYR
jgi:hypothetical protein